ncbi:Cell division and transport-associated protein TolR (TC 2.C.1.2.1) [Kaistia soli DSM 19436]|uniref:Cell division and transport-associated protein TolR (TC 2.C.1.2.1) n=1 Tax=Kaistia soli DSM 19436 TaxID=1122133 RepID=A0A1M5M915_9HYPH|nr:protein TolR [Kaistia soli]SHG73726.1 Cell division and transport-associated protein TolR (TC 2.C.1.2.1) [Kaistia soli DSM 19436]
MGMAVGGAGGGGGRRGARRRRRSTAIMSEINVTPFVDVILVLLIIFMVSAPMLTSGVPINLPESEAKALSADKDPISITIDPTGKIFLQDTEIPADEIVPKLKAIATTGYDERIFVRGDKSSNYGAIMQVMGLISGAGYRNIGLVTIDSQGG